MGGRMVVMAYDGVTPWLVNPHTGSNAAIQVTGPQADAIKQDSDFDGPLVDYREKGLTIELVGTEALGTAKVHHLKVTTKNGLVQHYYLEARDGNRHHHDRTGAHRLPRGGRHQDPVRHPHLGQRRQTG